MSNNLQRKDLLSAYLNHFKKLETFKDDLKSDIINKDLSIKENNMILININNLIQESKLSSSILKGSGIGGVLGTGVGIASGVYGSIHGTPGISENPTNAAILGGVGVGTLGLLSGGVAGLIKNKLSSISKKLPNEIIRKN